MLNHEEQLISFHDWFLAELYISLATFHVNRDGMTAYVKKSMQIFLLFCHSVKNEIAVVYFECITIVEIPFSEHELLFQRKSASNGIS